MFALVVALLAASPAHAEDSAEHAIKYRDKVMDGIGAHMGAISMIRKGQWSQVGDAAGHAQAMHDLSKMILAAFPKGSGPESGHKTHALPKIWEDWNGFEQAVKDYETETGKLVEVAKTKDVAKIDAQFKKVGGTCGGCHDKYREDDDD